MKIETTLEQDEAMMLHELTEIIETKHDGYLAEDKEFWERMQAAAKVLLEAYQVPK